MYVYVYVYIYTLSDTYGQRSYLKVSFPNQFQSFHYFRENFVNINKF